MQHNDRVQIDLWLYTYWSEKNIRLLKKCMAISF